MIGVVIGILALAGGEALERKTLGTALPWYESIDVARDQARRENKLVLALHVSGQFDNPGMT
ncbi:MAG: hypothetical protein EHM91_11285 [Planctomycetota bacterium]|nr:MAG: hypothetical protein EHM91_11285 [Planctomycetota bacterium]